MEVISVKTSIVCFIFLLSFGFCAEGKTTSGPSGPTSPRSYNTTALIDTTTSSGKENSSNSWQGFVGASIAVVFFGSNFVPIKKFDTGDGMFFQLILCLAIWMTGLISNCIQHFPQFYPLAMLGGFLWATGNVCVVPIIQTIGLGLGLLIWGSFNLLSGWASGRFGWFGLNKEIPNDPVLNYVSIVLAMTSAVFWVFVESNTEIPVVVVKEEDDDDDPEASLLNGIVIRTPETPPAIPENATWTSKLSKTNKRIIGCLLSVFSGTLYGLAFAPVIHIKDNYHGASQRDLDYVFAHFCGIMATSSVYFVIYCIIMKNKPKVYPSAILPGLVSGWMWGIADISWFMANEYLTEAVSFPIVTTGPGIIASLWGVIVFKEVTGRRNFIIMGIAYTLTISAAICAGLSKK